MGLQSVLQTLWGKAFVNLVRMQTICSPLLNPCNIHAIKGQHKYLSNLQLAQDFRQDNSGSLSVNNLIGSDSYYQFVTSDVIVGGFGKIVSAVSSKFGWVLSGPMTCGEGSSDSSVGTFVCSVRGKDTLSAKVESFWGFESLGIGVGEDPILANFEKSVKYNGERYVTKLP